MKVYLDIIFITNFIFDFIILLFLSLLLKRNAKIYRLIFGSLFGSITLLSLFIKMNTLELLLFKIIVSIFIIIISFGYKNIKYFTKNIYYFYMISIVLGGIIYFINNQVTYKNEGLLFVNNNMSINIILSSILSIILLYKYIKELKVLKTNYNKYYNVLLYLNNDTYSFNAFLDTGNKLIDPYRRWPIILINEDKIKIKENTLLVPYHTTSGTGLLKCIKINKIYIEGIGYKNKLLVGLTNSINIDGVDCILNERLLEG